MERTENNGDARQGALITLDQEPASDYRETAIPFSQSGYRAKREPVPEQLRKAMQLGRFEPATYAGIRRRFYQQAVFLKDYEDDAPYTEEFLRYFPTYSDLTIPQLRGYFTWRAGVRRGVCEKTALPFVYIYVYELLCGVGTASAADGLQKLLELEKNYLDAGLGDAQLRKNLRRWMPEYCILNALPPEDALRCAAPEIADTSRALTILHSPRTQTDEEVFSALCLLGEKKTAQSPVLEPDRARGMRLFAEAWRIAAENYRLYGKDLFAVCFGEKLVTGWYPLSNAVYYSPGYPNDMDYVLDDFHTYHRCGGVWQTARMDRQYFDLKMLRSFLHAAELRFRQYCKVGRALRESPDGAWALPYIEAAIAEDRRLTREAAQQRVKIDLSGLEQIRKDANTTRDSLLTEEELPEPVPPKELIPPKEAVPSGLPLTGVQAQLLRALLHGSSAEPMLREAHLTPSLAADAINEALFDEFGDVVLLCEDDRLSLVEDYTEDLSLLLGGSTDG